MKINGTILKIQDTKIVGNDFQIRDLWLTTDDQYPQTLSIQFTKDKCAVLNQYKIGQKVEISINLRGRIWTNKEGVDVVFNTIEGWKINKLEATVDNSETFVAEEDDDTLPF